MSLFLNGVETNTVMLNGVDTTGVWNGEVVWGVPPFYTLTLQTDGHGTLTANTLTGYPGDTITLTPTYNTYYRFNNYSNTGGSIAGNVFTFGDTDATAKANFKVNAFTASGGFEKGSNVTCDLGYNQGNKTTVVPLKYAITGYKTSNVPTAWYATSNRWKPSNASAYSITLKPYMRVTAYTNGSISNVKCTAYSYVNGSFQQSQSYGLGSKGNATWNYSKNFTTTTQGYYGISAIMTVHNGGSRCGGTYIATATTGTWVATGIAP